MFTKVYDKVVSFFKENLTFLVGFLIGFILVQVHFPYYISAPGGIVNLNSRVKIENATKQEGSYNLAYVSEYNATLPTLLFAFFNPNWDIFKKADVLLPNETEEDDNLRSRLLLEEANQNAIFYAYQKAGKTVTYKSRELYVTYVAEEAHTTLKVGDRIVKANQQEINSKEDLSRVIEGKSSEDTIFLEVIRKGKTEVATASIILIEGIPKIGIMLTEKNEYVLDPACTFSFKQNESGSSGGLMMTLAIYDALLEEDLTKGKKIVGTGTIDENGNVGEIGGVRYKLMGAVKQKADVFFVPAGENYEEAIKVKNEKKYNIPIIPVETFEDAVEYLKNN